jgi:hypothetical protein
LLSKGQTFKHLANWWNKKEGIRRPKVVLGIAEMPLGIFRWSPAGVKELEIIGDQNQH